MEFSNVSHPTMQTQKIAIESSITDLFARQVNLHGERRAIATEIGCITYKELDQLANRIAGALLANGHQHGQTVAILVEQGILQIAAILASLKAGGIYVPLDLSLGRRRLQEIVRHAESRVVLTDRLNRSTAEMISGGRSCVLNIEESPEQYGDNPPATNRAPGDFTYIYYTSGTTGDAKGVADTDRNVVHNIGRYTTSLNIDCNDRLTLLQSCGFSGAVSNIFSALLNGALLLPFDVRSRGVSALGKWLATQQPTIYHSVPMLFRQLMCCTGTLPTLRIVRLEGDRARAIDLETFNRHFDGNCTLVNSLGATETGITAQYFFEHGSSIPGAVVPVGKPTQDTIIDVVDARNRSLKQGRYGEIVITSPFLASGYWRRSDLTMLAFSELDDGTRSWHTGDVGRIDEHGLLEVHGRVDSSARIRGEWIDLSALEAAIALCPGVSDVIAGACQAGEAEPELTAWVVPEAGADVSSTIVRDTLLGKGWRRNATPTSIVVVERWPMDIHGKVDRRALHRIKEPKGKHTAPETPMEKLLVNVFEQVLGVAPISRTDDFFELGGDSLKSIQACLELKRRTGNDHAFGAIQHAPGIIELARILEGAVNRGCLVPLQPEGDGPALFCVHAHMGHVFNLRNLAMQFAPEQKFFGLQATGLDGLARPETTVEAMAANYVSHIKEVQPSGPYLIAGYCFGGWVAVEIARQLRNAGQCIDALYLIDPELPPGMKPAAKRDGLGHQASRLLGKLRLIGAYGAMEYLCDAVPDRLRKLRVRLMRFLARRKPVQHWLSKIVLRRPADAIDVMKLQYSPRPYDGDACILVPCDRPLESGQHQAWRSYIKGQLDVELMVGNASELLRSPYVRDLAARILVRIAAQTDG